MGDRGGPQAMPPPVDTDTPCWCEVPDTMGLMADDITGDIAGDMLGDMLGPMVGPALDAMGGPPPMWCMGEP